MKSSKFYLTLVVSIFVISTSCLKAQVTIGSNITPDANAMLDLKNNASDLTASTKGLLLPRVKLTGTGNADPLNAPVTAGMIVYNTATTGDVTPGYYYHNGTKWVRVADATAVAASSITGTSNLSTTTAGMTVTGTVLSAGTVNYDLPNGITGTAWTAGTQGTLGGTGTRNTYIGADGQTHLLPSSPGNIYTTDGTLTGNRVVTQADKTLAFTSSATTGTSHFTVDGTTFNVDATNNRVGIGTAAPSTPLEVNSGSAGAIKVVDGTQGAGKVLTSDANGVGTWQTAPPVPVASIFYLATSTVPSGYLECNGANVNRTTYANLFALIGTTYGTGDGSTTFTLPDLRGEFVRGWDHSRGIDTNRSIGTSQAASYTAVAGESLNGVESTSGSTIVHCWANSTSSVPTNWEGVVALTGTSNFIAGGGASVKNAYAGQVRPRNIALMPIIKY